MIISDMFTLSVSIFFSFVIGYYTGKGIEELRNIKEKQK